MQQNGSNAMTLDQAASRYAKLLLDPGDRGNLHGPQRRAIKYLASHGLTGPQAKLAAEKYHLGLVNPARKVDEPFTGYLAIPYITRAGVMALKFRCTADHDCKQQGEHHAKYGQPGGQQGRIYNPEAFFTADTTIGICEGEIDAIVISEILGVPCVGIPGVDHWKSRRRVWKRLFEDYEEIIVFADNDYPNRNFPEKGGPGLALARWIQNDLGETRTRLVVCDSGSDPSDMIANGKADTLRERAHLERVGPVRNDST